MAAFHLVACHYNFWGNTGNSIMGHRVRKSANLTKCNVNRIFKLYLICEHFGLSLVPAEFCFLNNLNMKIQKLSTDVLYSHNL